MDVPKNGFASHSLVQTTSAAETPLEVGKGNVVHDAIPAANLSVTTSEVLPTESVYANGDRVVEEMKANVADVAKKLDDVVISAEVAKAGNNAARMGDLLEEKSLVTNKPSLTIDGDKDKDEDDLPKDLMTFDDLKKIVVEVAEQASAAKVVERIFKPTKITGSSSSKPSKITGTGSSSSKLDYYSTDPNVAPETNIFDSNCFLDRVIPLKDLVDPDAFDKYIKRNYKNFGAKFEGCITVFGNPSEWDLADPKLNFIGDSRIWVTFGCSPQFACDFGDKEEAKLRQMLNATISKVAGLGEIGLDANHANRAKGGRSSMEVQRKVFLRQIGIARELKLPICLHVRDAVAMAMEALEESGLPRDWPLHMQCFHDTWKTCEKWMKLFPRMKFSFTPDSGNRDAVLRIPLDRLLCESGAPYNLPYIEKGSGTRNRRFDSHPGFVFHSAAQIAAKRNIPVGKVLEANRRNVREVYGI